MSSNFGRPPSNQQYMNRPNFSNPKRADSDCSVDDCDIGDTDENYVNVQPQNNFREH